MARKALLVAMLAVLGMTLAGCSPCGFIWDDWRSGKSCHGEPSPAK